MAKTIGIDFGNTQSIVSYYDSNTMSSPEPLILEYQKDTLQTVIGRIEKQSNFFVGTPAIEQAANLSNFSLHRYFKNDIAKKGGLIYFHELDGTRIPLNAQKFTTLYFRYLFTIVNQLLLSKYQVHIEDCNIAVTKPVDFDENQIRLLQLALHSTGFGDKFLFIDEPVAAAWHYHEVQAAGFQPGFYFFYDFGGGTFDCCVMKLDDDGFYPYILKSDKETGGRNIDCAIAAKILERFGIAVGNPNELDRDNRYTYILKIAESIKMLFSTDPLRTEYAANINFNKKEYLLEFTVADFRECIRPFIDHTIHISKSCYLDAKEKYDRKATGSNFIRPGFAFQRIILVGGSSLLPVIEEQLAVALDTDPARVSKFDPFHSISKGAAIYGSKVNSSDGGNGYISTANFGFGFLTWDNTTNNQHAEPLLHPQGNINESKSITYYLPEGTRDALLELVQFKDGSRTDQYESILKMPLLNDHGWWENDTREINITLTYNARGELSLLLNDGFKQEKRTNITRDLNDPEIKNELQNLLGTIRLVV